MRLIARHNIIRSMLTVAALLVFTSASEQGLASFDRFDVTANSKCPAALQPRAGDVRRLTFARLGRGWTLITSTANGTAYQGPQLAAIETTKRPLFGEKVTIFASDSTSNRVLVAWPRGDNRNCVWLAAETLLRPRKKSTEPFDWLTDLQNGPIPLRVSEVDPRDPQNALTVKAVLSNLNINTAEGIPVYDDPNAEKPLRNLKLFEFYSVFAKQDGRPRGQTHTFRYFLLGKAQRGEESLVGWVNADDVYLWNSRMAVFWAGTGQGAGWFDERMRGNPSVTEALPAAKRIERVARHRFPVLRSSPISREVHRKAAELGLERTPVTLSGLVDYYQVALRVQACRTGTDDCIDAEEYERRREDHYKRVRKLREIDILFLLDTTESMDVYFRPTADAIRKFARELGRLPLSGDSPSIKIGVAAYGDYRSNAASVSDVHYRILARFHDPTSVERPLRNVDKYGANFARLAPRDRHDDKLEAPFAALVKASQANWRSESGIRIIVHLADHGNRDSEIRTSNKPKVEERITVNDVVGALRQKRIIYIPVSVLGRPKEDGQEAIEARDAFLRQARRILEERGLPGEVRLSYSSTSRVETAEQRRKAVFGELNRALSIYTTADRLTVLRELCSQAKDGPHCKQLEAELKDHTRGGSVARIAEVVAEERGLTQEQIENLFSRSETVTYAYLRPVRRAQRIDTLTYWVALGRNELRPLRRAMDELCQIVKPNSEGGQIGPRIAAAMRTTTAVASGQDVPESALLATVLSLPFWEKMEVLSHSLREIDQMIQANDPKVLRGWRFRFCRSGALLGHVEQGRRISDLDALEPNRQGLVADMPRSVLQSYEWWVQTERGEGFYYIPIEYLP